MKTIILRTVSGIEYNTNEADITVFYKNGFNDLTTIDLIQLSDNGSFLHTWAYEQSTSYIVKCKNKTIYFNGLKLESISIIENFLL